MCTKHFRVLWMTSYLGVAGQAEATAEVRRLLCILRVRDSSAQNMAPFAASVSYCQCKADAFTQRCCFIFDS